ncbi:MAG: tryptophan--tRNA ligase [Mycoplasma sp.]|nr:tryptophan--tRNA ligase [Mycoplasma sp.]
MEKLVSGITATGNLTLGNYIGAIKNFIKFQDEYEMYIFVADLHAITLPIDPKTLNENKRNIMALYIACGLDINKVTLFYQSDVAAHSQLGYIAMTNTSMGELERMTQFKDKSQKVEVQTNGTLKIPTGLFIYPTLMAADILLYNPKIVPVGADQKQHLELTQNIAKRIKKKYKIDSLNIPQFFSPKIGSKIMSLTDPSAKMSKSSKQPKSYIGLLDDINVARKKIMSAKTDSENKVYLSDEKMGIKNLLTIYSSLTNKTIEESVKQFSNHNYGEFKKEVADVVCDFLESIQSKFKSALEQIDEIAEKGAKKASIVANQNLKIIMNKMGF